MPFCKRWFPIELYPVTLIKGYMSAFLAIQRQFYNRLKKRNNEFCKPLILQPGCSAKSPSRLISLDFQVPEIHAPGMKILFMMAVAQILTMVVIAWFNRGAWIRSEILPLRWGLNVDLASRAVRLEPGTAKNDEGRVSRFRYFPNWRKCSSGRSAARRLWKGRPVE